MARAKRMTFLEMLGSPETLIPIMLGVGSAIVLWAASDRQYRLAGFLAIAGSLGGFVTLLTLMVLYGHKIDPTLARQRQELLAGVEELGDPARFVASAEAGRPSTAATVERP